jgi:hypothetical protein
VIAYSLERRHPAGILRTAGFPTGMVLNPLPIPIRRKFADESVKTPIRSLIIDNGAGIEVNDAPKGARYIYIA